MTRRRVVSLLLTAVATAALLMGLAGPAAAGCYRCTKYERHDVFRSPAGTTECRLSGWPGNYSVWCRITATNTLVRWRAGTTADQRGSYAVTRATSAQRAWFRNAYRVRYGQYFRMGLDDPQSWAPEIGCVVTSTRGTECTYAPLMNGPQPRIWIRSGQVRICEWDRWRTPADRCRRIV